MRPIWPPYKMKLIRREMSKGGLRGHINANCIDCVFEQTEPGSWLQQIEECDAEHCCPLYSVRPRSRATRKLSHE